jgi:hypothetical protein
VLAELEWAETYSAACEQATRDLLECVADLSDCAELDDYWYEVPADAYPCRDEDEAYWAICD